MQAALSMLACLQYCNAFGRVLGLAPCVGSLWCPLDPGLDGSGVLWEMCL